MRIRHAALIALAVALVPASPTSAQSVDSAYVGIVSRSTWKGYDRGPGPALEGGVSVGLAGFSQNGDAGERTNVGVDLATWVPLESDANRFVQYLASAAFGYCVASCDQIMWVRRTTLTLRANGYWLPNASDDEWSPTIELTYRGYSVLEKLGGKQFAFNLSRFLAVERGFGQFEGTLVRGGVGTAIEGPVVLSLDAALAGSDWTSLSGGSRSFGYHSADLRLSVEADKRLGERHLSTLLTLGVEFPRTEIGATRGIVGLRFNFFPVYNR